MSDFDIVAGGLAVVFIGMAAIVGLLFLISFCVNFALSRKKAKKKNENADGYDGTAAKNGAQLCLAEENTVSADGSYGTGTDEELTAVIAAAVESYMKCQGVLRPRFKVTSFKRVGRKGI